MNHIIYSLTQYFERQDWQTAIARLNDEPGIVVVETGKADGDYYVRGLRDDYARQPEDVIGQAFIEEYPVKRRLFWARENNPQIIKQSKSPKVFLMFFIRYWYYISNNSTNKKFNNSQIPKFKQSKN